MHYVLVVDPLSHFLQQPVMPDIVKVGSQIKVEDPRLPLSYCFRHSLDRVVCCPLGPISIRPRLEVRLEHRFESVVNSIWAKAALLMRLPPRLGFY
jgi:hypothetical protein